MMSPKPTAGDDARTAKDAPTTEKRSGSTGSWDPTEPVDLDHLVPLDMANNIDDERTKQRITWVDGFGRAYADALEDAEPEATDEETVMTDGGIDTADELEHDPRAFSPSLTPAVVGEMRKDQVISKISFADVQLRESGALYWEEWSGADGLLPEWRWSEVRYLGFEDTESDGLPARIRVCADDWNRLPDAVQEVVDIEDGSDEPDLVTDGGTITVSNGDSPDRFPELVGFHRDILLTLARSGPTHGRGLGADLSTLRDEHIYDSRLYRNLGELVDAGLVDKEEFPDDDRAHEFRLAENGQHAVREHAQRLEGAVKALSEDQP